MLRLRHVYQKTLSQERNDYPVSPVFIPVNLNNDIDPVLAEYARRRRIQTSMVEWSRACGFEPALHHRLIIKRLEEVVEATKRGESTFTMFFLPPGSAKSTYTSKLFPPYFLKQIKTGIILACSCNADLAKEFGGKAKGFIENHSKEIGLTLKKDSKAKDDWETTAGGSFFCAGVGAKIAGRRADLGLIDDPVGSKEDADSDLMRKNQWDWYNFDFLPRLKPGAAQFLIMTRWHEKDLAGMLLDPKVSPDYKKWHVIKLPFFAKDNDPLGRKKGDILWPEYYRPEMYPVDSRVASSLYDQNPTPEAGDFFKAPWLKPYMPDSLPKELRIYVGSDHAISKKDEANKTCMVTVGVDEHKMLWILPEITWDKLDSKEQVDAMLETVIRLNKQYGNVTWIAEKGHISDCLGPYLFEQMMTKGVFFNLIEDVPRRDKRTRASSIQALCKSGLVHFPTWATWIGDAFREMLSFDNLGEDDFVDALGNVGRQLNGLIRAEVTEEEETPKEPSLADITLKQIREGHEQGVRDRELVKLDY